MECSATAVRQPFFLAARLDAENGFVPRVQTSPVVAHLLSGALAGGASRTVTAPLDRLKVILQVTRTPGRSSARSQIARVVRDEGLRGLFRGNGANSLKAVPEAAIKFVAYDAFKRLLVEGGGSSRGACSGDAIDPAPSVRQRMLAGGLAGIVAQSAVYPLDVVKTRLAASSRAQRPFRGISSTLVHAVRTEGARALYRGFVPALLGIFPYSGIDLAVFETLKRGVCDRRRRRAAGVHGAAGDFGATSSDFAASSAPVHVNLVCGATSSAIGQAAAYPLALARTRLQVDGAGGSARMYSGMCDVLRQTVRHEGPLALYRGLLPNLMKAVPAVAVTWAVYEAAKTHVFHVHANA